MMLAPGPVLVLVNPQDIVNIASAVRIARNFGIERMRRSIRRSSIPTASRASLTIRRDFVAAIEILPSLEAAVADSARGVHGARPHRQAPDLRPRAAAAELVEQASRGSVAIVAGREAPDSPTRSSTWGICSSPFRPIRATRRSIWPRPSPSWPMRPFACGESLPLKPHRKQAEPATAGQLEEVFGDWRRAPMIDFFKTRRSDSVMRSFREIVHRADLDGRESALMRAMGIEVVRYLGRVGAPLAEYRSTEPVD